MNVLFKDESFLIQGAVFEVYRQVGNGFLEAVYHECLEIEFAKRAIPFESEKELRIKYNASELKHTYRADFVCFNKILVEIKAVKELLPEHEAQVIHYLKATQMRLGILVNFGQPSKAQIKRLVL